MTRDLRPQLPRNTTNGVTRAEGHRALIQGWFEEFARADGVRCDVTVSAPGTGVVWIAAEAWLPVGGAEGDATRRTRVEIEVVPRDFCRWPLEFDVVLYEPGRARAYPAVVEFSRDNALALWRYMTGQAREAAFGFKRCRTGGYLRRLADHGLPSYPPAGPARFRALFAGSYAVWRPRNRPSALLPDVVGALPWLLGLFILLALAWGFVAYTSFRSYGFSNRPFWLHGGALFFYLMLIEAVVVALLMRRLKLSPSVAWTQLSAGPPTPAVATAGGTGTALPATGGGATRDVLGMFVLGALVVVSWVVYLYRDLAWPLLALAVVIGLLVARRPRVILSGGAPAARPLKLAARDSWQVLLLGLAGEATRTHAAIVAALTPSPDAEWSVRDETIWHYSVDGKEERRQTVIAYRSGVAFLHVYAYGDDLYVGWDAHVNRGRWVEERVGRGVHDRTGLLSEAHSIALGSIALSEYDIYDANFVVERVHAVTVKFLRQLVDEHKLDQEIDFQIVRQGRGNHSRDGEEGAPRPLLSRMSLRRNA